MAHRLGELSSALRQLQRAQLLLQGDHLLVPPLPAGAVLQNLFQRHIIANLRNNRATGFLYMNT